MDQRVQEKQLRRGRSLSSSLAHPLPTPTPWSQARKDTLQAEVQLCEQKLDRAQKLIGGLGGEKARWTAAVHELVAQQRRLIGDMLLSAGTIAYLVGVGRCGRGVGRV